MIKNITFQKLQGEEHNSGKQLIQVEYDSGESKRFWIDHRPGTQTKGEVYPEYPYNAPVSEESDEIKKWIKDNGGYWL